MAFIRPFKGLRYNPQRIPDLASVVSLPYDVLTEKDRDDLYQANPYNIVRLIWGKNLPGDGSQENKYTRAASLLKQWEEEGVLIGDAQDAFYLYAQDFALPGQGERARRGIIAKVRLGDWKSDTILRHESTFSEPRADRLNLIRATQANLDPIFALYERRGERIRASMDEEMKETPLLDFRDQGGVRHRLWALKESADHQVIMQEMSDRDLFIADGHHRYEAALQYRQEMMKREEAGAGEDAGYHYAMMMLVHMEDPGLVILPIHRLLGGLKGWNLREFLVKAREFFSVQETRLPPREEERQNFIYGQLERKRAFAHCYALYAGGDSLFLLVLEDKEKLNSFWRQKNLEAQRRLDVTILDRLVLEELLGLQVAEKEERIDYSPDMKEALRWVETGKYDLAFLLQPTTLQELKSVSLTGDRMPQKSTFFYPKLLSGLVMNRLKTSGRVRSRYDV